MFGKSETKQSSHDKKMEKYLKKYGLEDLSEKDLETLHNISGDLLGLGKFGTMMTMKVEEQAKVQHLSALVQQNWMILRKMQEISDKLD